VLSAAAAAATAAATRLDELSKSPYGGASSAAEIVSTASRAAACKTRTKTKIHQQQANSKHYSETQTTFWNDAMLPRLRLKRAHNL
jgi:hypothetical protein